MLSDLPSHHRSNGVNKWFENPWPPARSSFELFIKLVSLPAAVMRAQPLDGVELIQPVTTVKPDFSVLETITSDVVSLHATWLGHAGYLVQLPTVSGTPGARIAFDPMFSEYAYKSSWLNGLRRRLPPPCKIEDLPDIDFVAISHNHYDHCDIDTLVQICETSNSKSTRTSPLRFLVPLGVKETLVSGGIPECQVIEMDWWESVAFRLPSALDTRIVIACTPCQHNSGRGLTDYNKSLWSSWVVQMRTVEDETISSVYFAGDTGYRIGTGSCPVFREIGDKYGPFDIAMIPIWRGASLSFLGQLGYQLADDTHLAVTHASPEDAVQLARDVRARHSLAMHFATWAGSDHEANEPLLRLARARSGDWWEEDGFGALNVGQTVTIPIERN
ncbi:beta-lactamase superfamily domain-containing protein [Pisolithus sp. B1]|nr:beta-lactamase superfamily domain-containing protein [Pisolithus sp. B1]